MIPTVTSQCADCGLGTITAGEVYMVRDELWEQAWVGRRKSWHGRVPGTEILCLACLEARIGRALVASDFTAQVPSAGALHRLIRRRQQPRERA
jgi:hypothetical protein